MIVGILGGSFNPPHRGHLALARTVLDLGLTDTVTFVPAAVPPHKAAPSEADAATRLAMTALLAGEDDRLAVDDIELRRSGPSYTVDTLRALTASNPGIEYRLIIGSDMARMFASWREYRDILRLAPPLIAERPDFVFPKDPVDMFPGMGEDEARVMRRGVFPMAPVAVNSTMARRLLAGGGDDQAILAVLTEPVLAFIRERGLYTGARRNFGRHSS